MKKSEVTASLHYRVARRIKATVRKCVLRGRLEMKWMTDRLYLPLRQEHRELYLIIHRVYLAEFKKFPNLRAPSDFNEKFQWLKLFDQSDDVIACCDKIRVRDFARRRVGDHYLNRLYLTCRSFDEIDFDQLPDKFVIKTNHDSGTTILVRDKRALDRAGASVRIKKSLSASYGWEKGEWAYAFIEPRILVEEFLSPETSAPPADYKFYVADGRVKFVHYIYDRGSDTKAQTLDRDGHDLRIVLYPAFPMGNGFCKPEAWDEMLTVAERLGLGFKCVRVDLYCIDGRIYLGEMTFWPMAGLYKGDGQKTLGRWLDFGRQSFRPPVYHRLKHHRDSAHADCKVV